MDQKREDETMTAFLLRRIRNEILEEAACVIDRGQETKESGIMEDRYFLTRRRHGNLAGLAYAAGIRALKT